MWKSLIAATLLATVPFVRAQERITMQWFIPAGDSLPPVTVNVGDTLVFLWSGFHDVYIHPTNDCTTAGRRLVGSNSGASYTFSESDVGELEFVCDVGSHCELGMRTTVTVLSQTTPEPTPAPTTAAPASLSGETFSMDWFIPDAPSFPAMTVNVGDTLVFIWEGGPFHNVYIHPTGDCTETGRILVGLESPASYTFGESDVGEVEFVCDVGAHCEVGMRIAVTVLSADASPSPPTPAPTKPPNSRIGVGSKLSFFRNGGN